MLDMGTPTASPLVATYTTPAKVAAKLQLSTTFGEATIPTEAQVTTLILGIESEIERLTRMSWRSMKVTDELQTVQNREYYSLMNPPYVRLNCKFVKAFSSAAGDKLEVYMSGTWTDWLTTKTEGRGDDFWVDYRAGIIYFNRSFPLFRYIEGVRVTYRHGKAAVDGWVERLATLMAAIEVAENNTDQFLHPGGGTAGPDKDSQGGMVGRMQQKVDKILDEKPWLYDSQAGIIL